MITARALHVLLVASGVLALPDVGHHPSTAAAQGRIAEGSLVAQSDSIVIAVTNNMPHSMALSYDRDGRRPIGTIDATSTRTIVVRELAGDSVTLWATNGLPPHEFSQTFPTHPTGQLKWDF